VCSNINIVHHDRVKCMTRYKLSCGIMSRRLVLLFITYTLLILSGIRWEYCGTNDDNARSHYAQQRKWIWSCDIHSICLSARRSSKTSCSTSILRAKTSSASMWAHNLHIFNTPILFARFQVS
jgi:hypothetical protein